MWWRRRCSPRARGCRATRCPCFACGSGEEWPAPAAIPSAVQVLKARVGDCNEHAVLFVALARAAGVPARTVAGLVPVDGRFYYHAWAEVYLGDWVAVDPMLDEFPAGAAHLRFSIGGLPPQAGVLPLIGRIKLEVL